MRSLFCMLGPAIVVVAACGGGGSGDGGGGGGTAPSPATSVAAAGWQGTVTSRRQMSEGPLNFEQTFVGTATFDRGSVSGFNPADGVVPLVPAGATFYNLREGFLRLTHAGTVGPCTYGTGTWDVLMTANDGYLVVNQNGTYSGAIELPVTMFPVTVICPQAGAAPGESAVQMNLRLSGAIANSRMSGSMQPLTVAAATFTGTWDLAAR